MIIKRQKAAVHRTPNATMTTFAAPSVGSTELATWEVEMAPGSAGPPHSSDHEQVWLVLEGGLEAEVDGRPMKAGAGDALIVPAGVDRRISSPEGARGVVSTAAAAKVHTEAEGTRPLPWAS